MLRAKRVDDLIVWTSTPSASSAGETEWNRTETVIQDVYAPVVSGYRLVPVSGSAPSWSTDSTGITALEDTLRDSGDAPRVVSGTFSSSNSDYLAVKFADRKNNETDLREYAQDNQGYDFFVNIEATFTKVVGGTTVEDTGVGLEVWAKDVQGNMKPLATRLGERRVWNSRNEFGRLQVAFAVPNDLFLSNSVAYNHDPSEIWIRPKTTDNHTFTMKVDLAQVVPFKCVRASLVAANCSTTLVGAAPNYATTTVSSTVFASTDGFVLGWDSNLSMFGIPSPTPSSRRYFVYMYSGTGNIFSPYVDMTCKTEQFFETGTNANATKLHIQYPPDPAAAARSLPGGQYTFSTSPLSALFSSECANTIVTRLRAEKTGVGGAGNPEVASETVTIAVQGTYQASSCIRSQTCVADVDDGFQEGVPDGGVGIEDLLFYLVMYDAGVTCADVDDGTSTGARDGGVGIEDLLYYLGRYDAGC
jgi:hypothetical protein